MFPAKENSKSMELTGTKIFRTISVIKIIPNKNHDNQKIICTAKNSQTNEVRSSEVILKLLYKPEIKVKQSDTAGRGKPGDNVRFDCFTKANPRVTDIEWFLNDEKLLGESGDMLLLETVTPDMAGATVKCVAGNMIGSAEDEIKIKLKCK